MNHSEAMKTLNAQAIKCFDETHKAKQLVAAYSEDPQIERVASIQLIASLAMMNLTDDRLKAAKVMLTSALTKIKEITEEELAA